MATTTAVTESQVNLGTQVQAPASPGRFQKYEINWNASNNLFNKERTAQSAIGYYAQTVAYVVAGIAVRCLEAIQNLFYAVANFVIGGVNAVHSRLYSEEKQAEEATQKSTEQVEMVEAQTSQIEEQVVSTTQAEKVVAQEQAAASDVDADAAPAAPVVDADAEVAPAADADAAPVAADAEVDAAPVAADADAEDAVSDVDSEDAVSDVDSEDAVSDVEDEPQPPVKKLNAFQTFLRRLGYPAGVEI